MPDTVKPNLYVAGGPGQTLNDFLDLAFGPSVDPVSPEGQQQTRNDIAISYITATSQFADAFMSAGGTWDEWRKISSNCNANEEATVTMHRALVGDNAAVEFISKTIDVAPEVVIQNLSSGDRETVDVGHTILAEKLKLKELQMLTGQGLGLYGQSA